MSKKSKRQITYELNKTLKVKDECICLVCGDKFIKKQWQQAFCSNDCKNTYWNNKKDRHSKYYYELYNQKHLERLKHSTDRQRAAVHFCERVMDIEFDGDITNSSDCSHFLDLYLEDAKTNEYYCPFGSDESFG